MRLGKVLPELVTEPLVALPVGYSDPVASDRDRGHAQDRRIQCHGCRHRTPDVTL